MKKAFLCVLRSFAILQPVGWSQDNSNSTYKNPNAAVPERVRDLLGRINVEEKVAELESGWMLPVFGTFQIPSPIEGDHVNEAMAKKIAGNGLVTCAFLDEFLGTGGPRNPRLSAQHRNPLQALVFTNTCLGISIMFHGGGAAWRCHDGSHFVSAGGRVRKNMEIMVGAGSAETSSALLNIAE